MKNKSEEIINIKIFRNDKKEIYGFEIYNHGSSFICASVSVLSFNTINSIELFTNEDLFYEIDEKNQGYLYFEVNSLKENNLNDKVKLLLDSFYLGIVSISLEYKNTIKIFDDKIEYNKFINILEKEGI